jgi:hypothetical protein
MTARQWKCDPCRFGSRIGRFDTQIFEDVEDARKGIEQALRLLNIHEEGGIKAIMTRSLRDEQRSNLVTR